uniref:Uncharacterized protein n=1 Tax=Arundo donax TaxID=35708 RepID=A0A0A9ALB2_ARUDO
MNKNVPRTTEHWFPLNLY